MVVTIGQLAVLPITVLLWHIVAVNGWVDPLVSRTPEQVWHYLVEGWRSGEIVDNLAATMEAVVIAFVLASVVGVVAGIALALLPRTERILNPYLDALNAMPRIALAPIFIVYFGLDMSAKVALAFTIVVFVLLTSARAGVHSADHDVVRLTTVLGANKRQVFTKVYLPVSAPAIFGGLRLGLIYALLGVVGSEASTRKTT